MKVDRKNIRHWAYLGLFALNVMVAGVARLFRSRKGSGQVILYGHKLNGNLLAIYRYLRARPDGMDVVFLTMDPVYHRVLRQSGEASVLAIGPASIRAIASADAVISDHGLHVLQLLLGRTDLKFFDVWHGIPFKGFDADDFRLQHRYDETWVASPLLARMYVERFGFDAERVKVTGYARTDRLVRCDEDINLIKRRLGLDGDDVGKIVLFAPTWKQDSDRRSIFPFGMAEGEFFRALSALAKRTGATFVMRAHLNSHPGAGESWERIVQRPHAEFPDTEALLLVSDILVCDWSSIAFDYLLLERPTIFLDVEPPFAKGFSLGGEYRFGPVVPDMDGLLRILELYLAQPNSYRSEHGEHAVAIREVVYGDNATGMASANCVARLRQQLAEYPRRAT